MKMRKPFTISSTSINFMHFVIYPPINQGEFEDQMQKMSTDGEENVREALTTGDQDQPHVQHLSSIAQKKKKHCGEEHARSEK